MQRHMGLNKEDCNSDNKMILLPHCAGLADPVYAEACVDVN